MKPFCHLRPEDIAWIAGILEGEGCFYIRNKPEKNVIFETRIKVKMTDKDILNRLLKLIPGSRINNDIRKDIPSHYKKAWVWQLRNRYLVAELITIVLPWLGKRRAKKAKEILLLIYQANNRVGSHYKFKAI